ncbi:MAG: DinB family protein, partial [Planctomycetes bacterium]|nr:DinB family protein [Planctomycetota bacterium]
MQDALVAELTREAGATRRVLERVPEHRLAWKPHGRSMSLGQLALHVATIPGGVSGMLEGDGVDAAKADFSQKAVTSRKELLDALEAAMGLYMRVMMGPSGLSR